MHFEENEFYRDLFVKKDFSEYHGEEPFLDYKFIQEDPGRKYKVNMYGFRCGPFNKNADFLFAGCSVTYGNGIAEENVWGNVLSSKLKKNSFPIALSGVSISWIVDQLFVFFGQYGNPNMVLCFFPDAYRINLPIDGKHYRNKSRKQNKLMGGISYFSHAHLDSPRGKISNEYLKMPYDYEKAISPYLAINDNIRSIRRLEQYCNSVGIKLLWSSWEEEFLNTAKSIQKIEELKFDNYFDIREYGHVVSAKLFEGRRKNIFFNTIKEMETCRNIHIHEECSCYLDCHSEFREKIGEEFDYGTDNKNRLTASHPGAHYHLHCAEAFERRIKELGWSI